MTHPILGEIQIPGSATDTALATIRYAERDIPIEITCDNLPLQTTLELAADTVQNLTFLDNAAKQIAAADLCDTYNSNWREYDEVQQDRSLKTIINPPLSETDFAAMLSLHAIQVTGNSLVTFSYNNQEMFWGHTLTVTSFAATDFTDAHAELIG